MAQNEYESTVMSLTLPGVQTSSKKASNKYQPFANLAAAKQYIKEQGAPIVIKADGLANGKGVIVATSLDEAYEVVDSMLVNSIFDSAVVVVMASKGYLGSYKKENVICNVEASEEATPFVKVFHAGIALDSEGWLHEGTVNERLQSQMM